MLPIKQKMLAIVIGLILIIHIFDLVRRRKLREEYSWLWLLSGGGIFLLAVWPDLLLAITRFLGILFPVSTLFFFGLIFVILICIQFSVRISKMTLEIKNLAQKIALLEGELNQTRSSNK